MVYNEPRSQRPWRSASLALEMKGKTVAKAAYARKDELDKIIKRALEEQKSGELKIGERCYTFQHPRAKGYDRRGVGLGGMRERLRQLGGQLTILSSPDGTCVRATVPVPRTAAPAPEPSLLA